jgi:hypothetical protein
MQKKPDVSYVAYCAVMSVFNTAMFYLQFCVKMKIMTPTPRVECTDSGFWGLGSGVSVTLALRKREMWVIENRPLRM